MRDATTPAGSNLPPSCRLSPRWLAAAAGSPSPPKLARPARTFRRRLAELPRCDEIRKISARDAPGAASGDRPPGQSNMSVIGVFVRAVREFAPVKDRLRRLAVRRVAASIALLAGG